MASRPAEVQTYIHTYSLAIMGWVGAGEDLIFYTGGKGFMSGCNFYLITVKEASCDKCGFDPTYCSGSPYAFCPAGWSYEYNSSWQFDLSTYQERRMD